MIKIFFILFLLIDGSLGTLPCRADYSFSMEDQEKQLQNLLRESQDEKIPTGKPWNTRNPFDTSALGAVVIYLNHQSSPNHQFDLQGIFLGSARPSAIINKTVVGIGDTIKDCTVETIKENQVVLVDGDGNRLVLTLKQ